MTDRHEYDHEFEPEYDFGDLVRVDGYLPQVYRVDGIRFEININPKDEWSEIIYDLTEVYNGALLEAAEEDLTLVAEEEHADEYLQTYGQPTITLAKEARTMKSKEPRKPTARELSSQEAERRKQARQDKAKRVDELLDAKNDLKALYEAFGDSEYLEKQAEIDAKLAEEMAKGDGE